MENAVVAAGMGRILW